jgi:cytochrome c
VLRVTDSKGSTSETQFEVTAGNAPPEVALHIKEGNKTFFFPNAKLEYAIDVSDLEDGSLADGKIKAGEIAVNFDYAPEGFDPIEIAQNHRSTDEWVTLSRGKSLIEANDCLSCHRVDIRSIGPSYLEVADKYENDAEGQALIVQRIMEGSVGIWGEHAMSAHPDITEDEGRLIVQYILGLNDPKPEKKQLPLSGSVQTRVPEKENGKGGYLLRVAYTDKGAPDAKAQTGEYILALRNAEVDSEQYDAAEGLKLLTTPSRSLKVVKDGGWMLFKDIDLTGIKSIDISAEASPRTGDSGGVIELHLDAPDGPLVASTEKVTPLEIDLRAELTKLRDAWEKGGQKGPRPGRREVMKLFQKSYSMALPEEYGEHNLYFVIRNPQAKTGQMLMQINSFTYRNQSNSQIAGK